MTQSPEENLHEKRNWHWRNSMRPVRFFSLDARAAIPFLVLLFYARLVTLILTLMITAAFSYMERRGLTFPCSLRAIRSWMLGQKRSGWYLMRRRTLTDYG